MCEVELVSGILRAPCEREAGPKDSRNLSLFDSSMIL
jgi:hypothetical protein